MYTIINKNNILNKRETILIILFIISFIIRLLLTFNQFQINGISGWADSLYYLKIGESFAEGHFYPSFSDEEYIIVGPVIPLLVAASKLIFGNPILPMLIFNCFIDALLVFVLYKIGSFLVNQICGYILALWSIFNFRMITSCYQILKEPLIMLLIPLIVLCLLNAYKRIKPMLNIIFSSIFFSILIHTDERFFVYLPVIITIIIIIFQEKKEKIKLSLLWLVILIVSMIPWTIRNYNQHQELVILTPRTTAITSKLWGHNLTRLHFSDEGFISNVDYKIEDEYLLNNNIKPRLYGKYERYLKAFIHYWKPTYFKVTYIQYGFRPVKWSLNHNLNSLLFYGIFLPFYIVGLILSFIKKNWKILSIAIIPFFHSLLHTFLVWPLERYRLPMDFIVVLVALWFINKVYLYYKRRRGKLLLSAFEN